MVTMVMVMMRTVAETESSIIEGVINLCRVHGLRQDLIYASHSLWAMAVSVLPILQMRKL